MPIHQRRVIAKEILDQTIDHVKKQRENAAKKPEEKSEVRSKPVVEKQKSKEERYIPDENFQKIFTEIIGKTQEDKNMRDGRDDSGGESQPSVFEKLSRRAVKENVEGGSQFLEGGSGSSPNKVGSPDPGRDDSGGESEPSVFEKLSRRANKK